MNNRIINSMDTDELRNYIGHLQKLSDTRREHIGAQQEMIEILQRLYNCQLYREDTNMKLNSSLGALQRLEEELSVKYAEKLVS